MVIKFQLDKTDFLEYQLYIAAQIPQIQKIRRRKRFTFPVVFGVFGILFLTIKMALPAMACWFLALLWFSLYPLFHAKKYRKKYLEFVEEKYHDRFGKTISIDLKNDLIIGNDNGHIVKVHPKDVQEIVSLPRLLLIKLNPQQHMIIAKDKIDEPTAVIQQLERISERWNIPFNDVR